MKTLRALILFTPFALAACGEGYEAVKTDTLFPYGNQRTAGSGVAYVLAKMMPKKDLNIEAPLVTEPAPEPLQETKKILKDMDEVFEEAQQK